MHLFSLLHPLSTSFTGRGATTVFYVSINFIIVDLSYKGQYLLFGG